MMDQEVNVGRRLAQTARRNPAGIAVIQAGKPGIRGVRPYQQCTFKQLEDDSNLVADGLRDMGIQPGMRLVLMVRPGIDFISLVFAMLKAGIVAVLVDPGMGRAALLRCLQEVEPDGFVAIPLAHAVRCLFRRRFPQSRFHVTVGRRWFWDGPTLTDLRQRELSQDFQSVATRAHDPAAIIFTTGSTGPPKGVLYRHGNFDSQVDELRECYAIEPGEIDLAGFPLFGLFNCAMGVTTVVPFMDPTRPATVDPRNIIEPIRQWQVTQSFGSPALWNVVGRYCEEHSVRLPSLKRVLSAGAPVPPHVLRRMKNVIHPDGDIHTPYGATESLPVASISASEVLSETAVRSQDGAGTCVGRRFPQIDWKIIRIEDGPIATIEQAQELSQGQIGEIIVQGPVVTTEYVTGTQANPLHKIADGDRFWHRIGDLGYLDKDDRLWFCGRKAHRVLTPSGPMYSVPCEAILNNHEAVYRSALVGVGTPGTQVPVFVVEPWPKRFPTHSQGRQQLLQELRELASSHPLTRDVQTILLHRSLPVDIRHNAKISREKLAVWASKFVRSPSSPP